MESGSFIEENLRAQCSDMLYSVQTPTGKGYSYTLIAHQSRPEKLMAFRLMRYSIAAMQRHLEQGNEKLPVVIPLLFYHGLTSPYPYTTRWLDCFAEPNLAESVYKQAFVLVDITAMPDDEILSFKRVALLELAQKHIRTRDMLELAGDIAQLLNLWALPREQFCSLLNYIVGRGETTNTRQFFRYPCSTDRRLPGGRHDDCRTATAVRPSGRLTAWRAERHPGRHRAWRAERYFARCPSVTCHRCRSAHNKNVYGVIRYWTR